jgi:hypothetical protein
MVEAIELDAVSGQVSASALEERIEGLPTGLGV